MIYQNGPSLFFPNRSSLVADQMFRKAMLLLQAFGCPKPHLGNFADQTVISLALEWPSVAEKLPTSMSSTVQKLDHFLTILTWHQSHKLSILSEIGETHYHVHVGKVVSSLMKCIMAPLTLMDVTPYGFILKSTIVICALPTFHLFFT